ncbi:hypothetical protein DVH05_022763 [Phytophthora capsici]|nr:hypothetical protein DVH05_022763 [Phytophthora capsici]
MAAPMLSVLPGETWICTTSSGRVRRQHVFVMFSPVSGMRLGPWTRIWKAPSLACDSHLLHPTYGRSYPFLTPAALEDLVPVIADMAACCWRIGLALYF